MRWGIFRTIDFGLLAPVLVLLILSLTTLFSTNVAFLRAQLLFILIGLALFVFFSYIQLSSAEFFAKKIYLSSIVVLAIILFLGIESRGSVRWLEFFGFRIQFSEILKPFLGLSFAWFLTSSRLTFRKFFLSYVLLLPIAFLIYRQPDLGNTLIYVSVMIATLFVAGFPMAWFLGGVGIFVVTLPVVWHFLHDYQRQRILTFLDPTRDPLGTSYNSIQSMIAVGSGMFLGRGLGEGTQSQLLFLPERHTDFIFATLSEKLGFIGSSLVIVAYAFLLYRIFLVVMHARDPLSKVFSIAAFWFILIPLFVNIGMNIGILPITGITLPFVSYGGSSLVSNFILLGMLSAVSTAYKDKQALEIR